MNFQSALNARMASGRSNNTTAHCAGAGAIVCIVFFFVLGIPMFIASMVLFAISNGDYDEAAFSQYDDCTWSKWYNGDDYYDDSIWGDSGLYDCEDGRERWDDWKDAKKNMRIAAIVLLVFCLLFLFAGVGMSILMCCQMGQPSGGAVHSGTAVGTPVVHNTTVYTMPQQAYHVQPVTNPGMPPPYGAAPTAPYPANQMPPSDFAMQQYPK